PAGLAVGEPPLAEEARQQRRPRVGADLGAHLGRAHERDQGARAHPAGGDAGLAQIGERMTGLRSGAPTTTARRSGAPTTTTRRTAASMRMAIHDGSRSERRRTNLGARGNSWGWLCRLSAPVRP